MAKLNDLFKEFLQNIEPDDEAVNYAIKAHEPVREFLKQDEEFKDYYVDSFLYGSYRRHTAIGEIKDVDIVILTNFDTTVEENSPQNVLRKLKSALAKHYKDPENPEYQRRSIRINEPLPNKKDVEMTLDIIPAVPITDSDGILLVPDRESKEWVKTHPKGHIEYVNQLNEEDYSNGKFVPLTKMMKWWWKYQCSVIQPDVERPKPKGFWIECLTSENFNPKAGDWADHIIATLTNISTSYTQTDSVPELMDPGLPDHIIKTSMTSDEFKVFMEAINSSLELAQKAYGEENELESSKLWREVFGEEFPLASNQKSSQTNNLVRKREDGEQFIEDLGISEVPSSYRVGINAHVIQDGFRPFFLRLATNPLRKKRKLQFFIEKNRSNLPPYCQIMWKVKNTGSEADYAGDMRGEITKDKGKWQKDENTKYMGSHYVECYVILNNKCVAKDRLNVPIGQL